ncbi:lactate utilization protein [Caloramator sp. E03]|uniref:lactate utilization protein n=1 Tax=Caloramator sp. E03 TaxID=2576307 RepID=UPI0011108801|nr:lactate utilization protein [Caloramator sp. E03]QCX34727.1 lactate utilization protein [Caloramator sp. E03]
MDKNTDFIFQKRVERTIENLEKNNIEAFFVQDEKELIDKIMDLVPENATVSVGGSMTLFETGVIEHLRSGRYNFLDRYKEGLSMDDIKEIYRKSFFADAYFTSSNAITEEGEIYNVDGNGNRVAAMIYGPDKVIIVAGINKIVKDLDEAIERNRAMSAPANAKRLNKNTPCAKIGYCMDCTSPERICRNYVLIKSQGKKGRMYVIFVNKHFGY